MFFIPGITSIHVIAADRLPAHLRELSLAGQEPLVMLDFISLDTGPGATAREETEQAPEGVTWKTTLSFITTELPFPASEDLAFLVYAADGSTYLIGAKEPPFPKVKLKNDLSTPSDGQASRLYTVEWEGPLIRCKSYLPSF